VAKRDNDSAKMTDRVHLPPLEGGGLGQTAWAVTVIVALFLIAGFIAVWLFEQAKDLAVADRAFIPLQAIFIYFVVMRIVMAFQRCLRIGLTRKSALDEADETGWLFSRRGWPESAWRACIAKNRLTTSFRYRNNNISRIHQISFPAGLPQSAISSS
jgi:hypothetical protein